ncbi:RNA polymerase sigma factor [Tropicimonas sp. S265A]|uniref:RNA polymerase sigma factor n=1 Tax=Tropicimonas sp. S265A TaxID=3415134 RepID=UPI003C7B55F2
MTEDIHTPRPPCVTDLALVALIPKLRPLARRLGRDRAEADDLLQETLTAILIRLRDGAAIDNLPAYGRMVLKNAVRRHGRLEQTLQLEEDSTDLAQGPDETAFAALEAIAHLPDAQARLVRAALEGDSTLQLAAREGIPPGTVHSRLARARAQLRVDLDMA